MIAVRQVKNQRAASARRLRLCQCRGGGIIASAAGRGTPAPLSTVRRDSVSRF
jgi:hypothetical protein